MTSVVSLNPTVEIIMKSTEYVLKAVDTYFEYKKEVAISQKLEFIELQNIEIIKQTASYIKAKEKEYLDLLKIKNRVEEFSQKEFYFKKQEIKNHENFLENEKRSLDDLNKKLCEERNKNANSSYCKVLEKVYRKKLLSV